MLTPNSRFIVYQHISPSGKSYIGITHFTDPNERWRDGKGYGEHTIFGKAIKKYGWNNFEHIILHSNLTEQEACLKEAELIQNLNLTDARFGYNGQSGGLTHFNYSDEVRKRISINTSKALKGKPKSDLAKEATRRANLGNPNVSHPHPYKGKTIDQVYTPEQAAEYRYKTVHNRKTPYGPMSMEQKAKLSMQNKGRRFYTNGLKDIMLKPTDEIPKGFYLGRSKRKRG